MKVLMLVVLMVASLGPGGQEAEPGAVVEAFHRALEAGDRDGVLATMAPDVVIFESGGAEMSRDEYAAGHLGGDMTYSAATDREVLDQSQQTRGDLGFVLTRSRTSGTFRDREIDSTGVETMVLRRFDDGWRIVHIHWSSRSARR